jgi:AcrR family transcriptional regulator
VLKTNEKFYELPEEKQLRIINAGFEVFGQSDYKHASTEEIAAKAGISKGLLFYYFHDKRTLYLFLFEKAANMIKVHVVDAHIGEITDFFELCAYAAERKYEMLCQSPYIMDFIVRAFYSQRESVSEDINKKVKDETASIFATYFTKVDFSKFRDDVSPKDIYQMLAWMVDGYLHEVQRTGRIAGLDDVMEKYRLWSTYFKKMSYKEEYLK